MSLATLHHCDAWRVAQSNGAVRATATEVRPAAAAHCPSAARNARTMLRSSTLGFSLGFVRVNPSRPIVSGCPLGVRVNFPR